MAHADGTILRWDASQHGSVPQVVGRHNQPVKDVFSFFTNGYTFLVSGGWDSMVKFYQIENNNVK